MTAFATAPVLSLTQIAQWSGGDLVVREVPAAPLEREALLRAGVDGVTLDSRAAGPGMLFVPLPGSRTDGHDHLDDAFARGAAAAFCARERYAALEGREPGPLVVVDDVTAGLQRLARGHRAAWPGLLIGVTGSVGKTTTKDLVAAVLATAHPTLKTEGNLNNHWGVPLTLLRLRAEHRSAVVEIAMNHPGEIAALAAIARPSAAVITSAGSAHLEYLGSLEAIAREKASLAHALDAHGVAFANADAPRLMAALAGLRCRLVTYGLSHHAEVHARRIEPLGEAGTRIEVEGFPALTFAIPGRHQASNALAALAVARELRLDPGAAVAALAACAPAMGRLVVRRARGATLLVDCYNANPDSTRAALETLAAWPGATRRIAVLGDMLELGPDASRLHAETAASAAGSEVWAIGRHADDLARGARAARAEARVFADLAALRAEVKAALGPGVVVLVKASRGAALERVLEGLEGEG
jgi:UDP-N-acetylmuramoyl-tripeptide--D-alanyl-D-alanine ligase